MFVKTLTIAAIVATTIFNQSLTANATVGSTLKASEEIAIGENLGKPKQTSGAGSRNNYLSKDLTSPLFQPEGVIKRSRKPQPKPKCDSVSYCLPDLEVLIAAAPGCTTDKAGTKLCIIRDDNGKHIGTTLSRLNGRSRVVPVRKAAAPTTIARILLPPGSKIGGPKGTKKA